MVAGIGLVGLFPTGVPETRAERGVLGGAAAVAVGAAAPRHGRLPDPAGGAVPARAARRGQPAVHCPRPALQSTRPRAALQLRRVGHPRAVPLYLRYRRGSAAAAPLIRWLLVGWGAAMVIFAVLTAALPADLGTGGHGHRLRAVGPGCVLVLVSLAAALSRAACSASTGGAQVRGLPDAVAADRRGLCARPPPRSASWPAVPAGRAWRCCSRPRRRWCSSRPSAGWNGWPTGGCSGRGSTATR